MTDTSPSPLLTAWRSSELGALSPEQAQAIAVELGLDPRGYPLSQPQHWDVDDYEDRQPPPRFAPWGGPDTLLDGEDDDDHTLFEVVDGRRRGRTVFEACVDDAESRGMGVVEHLGTMGIGPEAEHDDEDEDEDY